MIEARITIGIGTSNVELEKNKEIAIAEKLTWAKP